MIMKVLFTKEAVKIHMNLKGNKLRGFLFKIKLSHLRDNSFIVTIFKIRANGFLCLSRRLFYFFLYVFASKSKFL